MRDRIEGWVWLAAAVAVVLSLPPILFPTYDDGWNLHQLDLLSRGDWRQLWHHGAPLFYLFYLPLYKLGAAYTLLGYVNAGLGLAGLWLLAARTAGSGTYPEEKVALALLTLAAPLAWVNLFGFTVEAGGLFWLGLALTSRNRRIRALLLAATALWNYKLALAIPVCLVIDLWEAKTRQRVLTDYLVWVGVLLAGVYILFLAIDTPADWWRPPGTYMGLLGRDGSSNASGNRWDWLFYARYLLEWDAWQWWVAGAAGWWMMHRRRPLSREAALVAAILAAGIFLPKAPRWLLPTLPLLAGWALGMARRIPYPWMRRLALAGVAWGACSVNRQAVSDFLPTHEIENTSLRSYDALTRPWPKPAGYTDSSLYTRSSTLPYRISDWGPYTYVAYADLKLWCPRIELSDGYSYLIGEAPVKLSGKVLLRLQTPTNAVPLLWLEHAEYTGLSYTETMARWERYRDSATQVALVRVACP